MTDFGDWTKTYKATPVASPSNHIVDANKKVGPVASVNSIRDSIGQGTINILIKDGLNPGDFLYTHPTPPSELIDAANEVAAYFRKAKSNWMSKDQLRSLRKLCDVLDKLNDQTAR